MAPTMPEGMPGDGGMYDPTISPEAMQSMADPQMGGAPMGGAPMGGAPMGGAPIGAMMGMDDPMAEQYAAITQEDGSVLLHLKNPDGSMGPAVKIIPPIKRGKLSG